MNSPERPKEASESPARTKYFSNFALSHLKSMRVHQEGGILAGRTKEEKIENKGWRNISEHCLTEAVGADILAEHLGLDEGDRNRVVQAVLLHDWYKRREVKAMKELGGAVGHLKAESESVQRLAQYVDDKEVVRLARSLIPEARSGEYITPQGLGEKIVHFIDLITQDARFVRNYDERLIPIMQRPPDVERSEVYRRQYGGKSLYEVQKEIGDAEQEEFETILGLEHGTLSQFLMEKLNERIITFSNEKGVASDGTVGGRFRQ